MACIVVFSFKILVHECAQARLPLLPAGLFSPWYASVEKPLQRNELKARRGVETEIGAAGTKREGNRYRKNVQGNIHVYFINIYSSLLLFLPRYLTVSFEDTIFFIPQAVWIFVAETWITYVHMHAHVLHFGWQGLTTAFRGAWTNIVYKNSCKENRGNKYMRLNAKKRTKNVSRRK